MNELSIGCSETLLYLSAAHRVYVAADNQGDEHGALALGYLAFVLTGYFDSSGRLSGTGHLRQQC